jgi:hypothetical protein
MPYSVIVAAGSLLGLMPYTCILGLLAAGWKEGGLAMQFVSIMIADCRHTWCSLILQHNTEYSLMYIADAIPIATEPAESELSNEVRGKVGRPSQSSPPVAKIFLKLQIKA